MSKEVWKQERPHGHWTHCPWFSTSWITDASIHFNSWNVNTM